MPKLPLYFCEVWFIVGVVCNVLPDDVWLRAAVVCSEKRLIASRVRDLLVYSDISTLIEAVNTSCILELRISRSCELSLQIQVACTGKSRKVITRLAGSVHNYFIVFSY